MSLGDDQLKKVAEVFGTPCYVYELDHLADRVASLRSQFGNRFRISYAVKANPNPQLLLRLKDLVDTLDVSAAGELERAIALGWEARRISFTGPGKRSFELEAAVNHQIGEVIVESIPEALELAEIAGARNHRQRVLIRIAPSRLPRGFGVNMAGRPTQFGIDEEDAGEALETIRSLPSLELVGFHCYSGTQCLDPDAIAENYQIFIEIFSRLAETYDFSPTKLVFGSGLGIPYHKGDTPLDLGRLADRVNPAMDAFREKPHFRNTECYLETGRYLIGEAGTYLTRVVRRKSSRGTEIAICDGGMNHHLGACGHLGSVIHRNYPVFRLGEGNPGERSYDLVGPLCTSIDTLGHHVKFDSLEVGDIVGVRCSGAYGLSASPVYFISHPLPREVLVATKGDSVQAWDVSTIGLTPVSSAPTSI